MNYIIQRFVCIIFLMNSSMIFAQEYTYELETMYMNCIYKSLNDNGAEFKAILQEAEQKLIDEKLLKDTSGKSYIALYKNMKEVAGKEYQSLGVLDYIASRMMESIDMLVYFECEKEFMEHPKRLASRMNKFTTVIESIDIKKIEGSLLGNILSGFVNENDFEYDFYKYFTFLLLDTFKVSKFEIKNTDRSLPKKEEQTFKAEELKHALKVEIDSESRLFLNDKGATLEELQKKVISYLKQNKSKSVVLIKNSRKTSYKAFLDMQKEIVDGFEVVRNQLAKEKFNRTFDELKETEKKEIKNIYPLNIKYLETDE